MLEYYSILEVPPYSSLDDIKKAYKRLALMYHPDRNPSSEEKFKQINEAYSFLLKNHGRTSKKNAFTDVFSDMFNNMHKRGSYRQLVRLNLSLDDALNGVSKNINVLLEIPCRDCNILSRPRCPNCRGMGFIKKGKRQFFNFPPGVYQDQIFKYPNFVDNTDLHIKISIVDSFFKFKGKNVTSEERINIFRAILGGPIKIRTLTGIEEVSIPEATIDNYFYILKNKGIGGGNHTIRFNTYIPDNISEENKTLLLNILNETE